MPSRRHDRPRQGHARNPRLLSGGGRGRGHRRNAGRPAGGTDAGAACGRAGASDAAAGRNAGRARSRRATSRPTLPPLRPRRTPRSWRRARRRRTAATLDDLRAILDRFEGCALRATATQLVFARGNPQARVMFVGEAPGYEEDKSGQPFVGRSGPAARPHDGGDRARRDQCLHRQHRAVASARQPHADAAGVRDLPAVHHGARSSSPMPTCWSASAVRRRRRCSTSGTASPNRAGAGTRSRPAAARSARWRRSIRRSCCAVRCRSASPGAIS